VFHFSFCFYFFVCCLSKARMHEITVLGTGWRESGKGLLHPLVAHLKAVG